ncbi:MULTISPECIES: ATP-binding protein [unclassified Halomonas]|uniref:ATP-binding protein n=1 Tax=unclassified Halomonas TaxID=2609666 RepID=UPI0009905BD0|nr:MULTISPECIES: acylphosphatase [unclassified Halomonas]AQU81882.1 hypothetical protein B2G49_04270 [Halomonas sp. 'Soap Lake \
MENNFDVHIIGGVPRNLKGHQMIEAEAWLMGLSTVRTSGTVFNIILPNEDSIGFSYSRLQNAPKKSILIAKNKEMTKEVLKSSNLPVAEGQVFESTQVDEAVEFAKKIGYPVVVKPISGKQGRGVFANLQTDSELKKSFVKSSQEGFKDSRLIVEKHIKGKDFRVFSTRDRVCSVVERIPAFVVGDGISTISELVVQKNERRKYNPRYFSTPINENNDLDLLARQGYSANSIPESGAHIRLSSTANLSRGGESRECIDVTHPSILEVASLAVRAIPGLEYAGVDILMEDPSIPIDGQDFSIVEINSAPMLVMHPFPGSGKPRNVPRMIVEDLLIKNGFSANNPVSEDCVFAKIIVTGTVRKVGYLKWIKAKMDNLELKGYVRVSSDFVEAYVEGCPHRISLLTAACLKGSARSLPKEVKTYPMLKQDFDSEVAGFV